jgi:hypothetical protein
MRALLVAALVMMPPLLVSASSSDAPQIAVILALIAGVMTFIEYFGRAPSLVEFRFAPPYNRLKFAGLFAIIVLVSIVSVAAGCTGGVACSLAQVGGSLGQVLDFPFSPVRLVVLLLPEGASAGLVDTVRIASSFAYTVSLSICVVFLLVIWLTQWPRRGGAFNVWTNLPLFDPTAGGDVLARLRRDSHVNIAMGLALPFAIPVVIKAVFDLADPISVADPKTLIWTVTAWAFLPASMVMRGIALGRVAQMIDLKRRRAYARSNAAVEQLQSA